MSSKARGLFQAQAAAVTDPAQTKLGFDRRGKAQLIDPETYKIEMFARQRAAEQKAAAAAGRRAAQLAEKAAAAAGAPTQGPGLIRTKYGPKHVAFVKKNFAAHLEQHGGTEDAAFKSVAQVLRNDHGYRMADTRFVKRTVGRQTSSTARSGRPVNKGFDTAVLSSIMALYCDEAKNLRIATIAFNHLQVAAIATALQVKPKWLPFQNV